MIVFVYLIYIFEILFKSNDYALRVFLCFLECLRRRRDLRAPPVIGGHVTLGNDSTSACVYTVVVSFHTLFVRSSSNTCTVTPSVPVTTYVLLSCVKYVGDDDGGSGAVVDAEGGSAGTGGD